ncbi:MAG: hypothetical protein V4562_12290 [Pseudomonadota bacterium]
MRRRLRWTRHQIRARYPLWNALADLWLDTWYDEAQLQRLGERIHAMGYHPEEVWRIALYEVAPAVRANLWSVAGEWAGFDARWLRRRIVSRSPDPLAYLGQPSMWQRWQAWHTARYLRKAGWGVVARALRPRQD